MSDNYYNPEAFLQNKAKREITSLFLTFLHLLEDMKFDDIITEEEYQRYRKRVLDSGNGTIRAFSDQLSQFNITLKTQADYERDQSIQKGADEADG